MHEYQQTNKLDADWLNSAGGHTIGDLYFTFSLIRTKREKKIDSIYKNKTTNETEFKHVIIIFNVYCTP